MVFCVQILGSNSALAAHGRHPTSQVVNCNNELFLIDCGEGTQMRMSKFHVKRSRINHIFISHLHGDHYFGLIGLLTSYHLMGRISPLTIFAPEPLKEIISKQLAASNSTLNYTLTFKTTRDTQKELILETDHVKVFSFPLKHRIPTSGFLFEEQLSDRRIIKENVVGLGLVPAQFLELKEGRDIVMEDGRVMPNAELTLPPHEVRRYAYCSDTMYSASMKDYIQNIDLLYHEATFLKEDHLRAAETHHSTTVEAANVANEVGAHQLLIGHFSSKYPDISIYREECLPVFPNTTLAVEGNTFGINRDQGLEIISPA